ncbi:MAG: hypothetical protein RL090_95 [Bacteroidota bacterium]
MLGFRLVFTLSACVMGVLTSNAPVSGLKAPDTSARNDRTLDSLATSYADSVINTMDWDRKVGQLFMVEAYSNKDDAHVKAVSNLVRNFHIGGVIFFQGSPFRQASMTNLFQSQSKTPLLVGIDGEWGLSMRLDSTTRFPRQMTLGASNDDSLMFRVGAEIGRQCKRMGIHVNFAPVVDVNTNPINPVISSRSFGEDKKLVARMAIKYMEGMRQHGVLACGKHFPGHGNTDSDSHFTLPVVRELEGQLDSVELYPFREIIREGVASIMVAHLNIPALDPTPKRASTLSPEIVNGLLRKKMGFDGLIFTDALNMKGVADHFQSGELEILALKAGNDVLLFSKDVPVAWKAVRQAVSNGELDTSEINLKVKRVLKAKYKAGLHKYAPVDLNGLTKDLNTPYAKHLAELAYEKSLVLVYNRDAAVPLRMDHHCSMASLTINDDGSGAMYKYMSAMAPMQRYWGPKEPKESAIVKLVNDLAEHDYVVVGIHNTNIKASSGYGIPTWVDNVIKRLSSKTKVVVAVFGTAYSLSRVPSVKDCHALILAHEDTENAQKAVANLVFGVSGASARLPASTPSLFKMGDGVSLRSAMLRLRNADPFDVGLNPADFRQIDSICKRMITDKAAPGCQVLVAWKDRIVYHKAFGKHTYDREARNVELTDVYDVASVTKVASTAIAAMRLVDQGKLDINKPVSFYLHELKNSNKKDLSVSDIMTHTAGLKSWIPFYQQTLENGKPSYNFYHKKPDANYSVTVCDSLFIAKSYGSTMWDVIVDSPLGTKGKLVYSDLGLIIMQRIIEQISGVPLDRYVYDNFYKPLGLSNIMYNPWTSIPLNRIPPTERDTAFRKKVIKGYVHDPAAAMMGGVSGHAGLFSDSYSLAVIMQMLMNGGEYGGMRFISSQTVQLFTSKFAAGDSYRGLLFDKPDRRKGEPENTAKLASVFTFGHTGFTGTAVWADPEHDLVFVFLSNRVYPNAEPNKLSKGRYRPSAMQAAYDVILRKARMPNQ